MAENEPRSEEFRPWPVVEAARHLRVSERTLWQLIKQGRVATFKIGRRVYIGAAEMRRIETQGTSQFPVSSPA